MFTRLNSRSIIHGSIIISNLCLLDLHCSLAAVTPESPFCCYPSGLLTLLFIFLRKHSTVGVNLRHAGVDDVSASWNN